ncbi:MAG: hypothetical protein ABI844_00595 [Saprospiraceae bacterium]
MPNTKLSNRLLDEMIVDKVFNRKLKMSISLSPFKILSLLLLIHTGLFAQNSTSLSHFDSRYWGVVLDNPKMKDVVVKRDVTYLKDEKGNLKQTFILLLILNQVLNCLPLFF